MKNKLDVTNLVKIAGWIAVAVGGLMAKLGLAISSNRNRQKNLSKSIFHKKRSPNKGFSILFFRRIS